VPGSLDTPTGGYAYDRRIIAELRQLGWDVECLDIGDGFPSPDESVRSAARSRLLKVPDNQPIVMDGLALGVLPDVAAEVASRHPLLALVHHPLALEWGMSAERADALHRSEQAALAIVREVVVTSPTTAKLVASDYGVPADRITVARPGSDPAPRSSGSRNQVPHLLSVGAVSSECLAALFDGADLFVLASRFEGYGMAYAEALSHGLPVIGTTAGAVSDTVPHEAGLLVTSGDVGALARALRSVIGDADLRRRLSDAALAAAQRLPTWQQSGAIFAAALEKLA